MTESNVFVHEHGICETSSVGEGTRVWAFAHVLPGAKIGRDCNICDHVFIENDVVIGDRVTVKTGVQVWDGIRLADDVFVGPSVIFTNDRFPRSKWYPEQWLVTEVGPGASLGANSTILPGISIGRRAMVGAGSVVTHSVPPFAIVVGNPARIVGYVEEERQPLSARATRASKGAPTRDIETIRVSGVELRRITHADDLRGSLIAVEFADQLPFVPRRFFLVFDVPSKEVRGEHAHRVCEQFLICVAGELSVVVDDGVNRQEFLLDTPSLGVYVPPLVWGTQYAYSSDARLLVLASHEYDPDDYIRSYEDFLGAIDPPRPS
jgi:UDP-2-acetamido-3-amino-2,3-dideoxy-glucuronate N-acetyltransferase